LVLEPIAAGLDARVLVMILYEIMARTLLSYRSVRLMTEEDTVPFKNIWVPVDANHDDTLARGQAALLQGTALADLTGATLSVVAVFQPPTVALTMDVSAISGQFAVEMHDLAEKRFHARLEEIGSVNPNALLVTLEQGAAPAFDIIDRVVAGQGDLIIVPSHGRTGVKRILLGSVAERIARHSPVPVLILRLPD